MYIINFSSVLNFEWNNAYGYYCGNIRTKVKEDYPVTTHDKNSNLVKKYSSKAKAESSAKKIADRCAYVVEWRVEELIFC